MFREVRGIFLYQGFSRPILPEKHQEYSERCYVDKIGRGNGRGKVIFFNFPKKWLYCTIYYRVLR